MNRSVTIKFFAVAAMLVAVLSVSAQEKQAARVYRDGNSWVEETAGSIPAAHGLILRSAVSTVHVRGASQSNVTYTIKKRVGRSSEEMSRSDMAIFEVTVSRHGDAVMIEHPPMTQKYPDRYWADGADGSGQNILGKILMIVRELERKKRQRKAKTPRAA